MRNRPLPRRSLLFRASRSAAFTRRTATRRSSSPGSGWGGSRRGEITPNRDQRFLLELPEGVMSGKILKDKLIKGDRVYGTFFQHAVVPALVDFIPPGVLDFVIVSAEHNALDIADFLPL